MTSETLNQIEPTFSPEDIQQAPFSEEDLQKISDMAIKSFNEGDYMTEEEFNKSFE